MPYNGVGVFTRIYSWVTDQANGILVRADRMDTDTNDIATGLSNCMTRDGQSPPTAPIPMGSQKLTGLANGVSAQDATTVSQVFTSGSFTTPTLASPTITGTITATGVTGALNLTNAASVSVPTATVGDSTTNAATTAFVQATAFATALPSQTGNNGKFVTTNGTTASWALPIPDQTSNSGKYLTTNGTIASWATLTIPGTGGTTNTGSVTLSTTTSAYTITPATPGLYATLPDATTMTKAVGLFSIYNAGDYDYGVKDSTGTQLGWIRARTGAVIGLSDSSSSAGVWSPYGLEKTGITATYVNPTVTNMAGNIVRVALDANRTCFLFGGVDCYGIVYDQSTQTWGSAVLIRASVSTGAFQAVLAATNKVLVVTCDTTTAMEAVTLSIATNTITVNSGSKGTATLAGNLAYIIQLIAISTSWVVGYSRNTSVNGIRAITVSGDTPTIGAESALSGTDTSSTSVKLYASGSIVRTLSNSNTQPIYCKPFTVSGSTLSAGTEASSTQTVALYRSFVDGNGNIVCNHVNTTHYATVFKLTSTTEVASTVSLGTAPGAILTTTDYIAITASKTLVISYPGSGTTWYANIVTDTSGTASAGTEISGTVLSGSSILGIATVAVSGNFARFVVTAGPAGGGGGGTCSFCYITVDCSGSSPVLTAEQILTTFAPYYSSYSVDFPEPRPSNLFGVRNAGLLLSGTTAYLVNPGARSDLLLSAGNL